MPSSTTLVWMCLHFLGNITKMWFQWMNVLKSKHINHLKTSILLLKTTLQHHNPDLEWESVLLLKHASVDENETRMPKWGIFQIATSLDIVGMINTRLTILWICLWIVIASTLWKLMQCREWLNCFCQKSGSRFSRLSLNPQNCSESIQKKCQPKCREHQEGTNACSLGPRWQPHPSFLAK